MANDPTPVEIVAEELRVHREIGAPTDSATNAGAFLVLNALHAAGWRIVRVHDAWPGDNGGTAMLVDEEWTPTGDDQAHVVGEAHDA